MKILNFITFKFSANLIRETFPPNGLRLLVANLFKSSSVYVHLYNDDDDDNNDIKQCGNKYVMVKKEKEKKIVIVFLFLPDVT